MTSAVWLARMPCFLNFWPWLNPGVFGPITKLAWPRLELGVDGRDDDVEIGDAAVRDPRLGAVEHPLVLGLVVHGGRPQIAHVASGVGLADGERAELDLLGRAEALRHPLAHLLGCAVGHDPGDGERAADDRETDPGVTPRQLFERERERQTGGIGSRVGEELERVEPDLGRLFDDGPRRLFPLVPFVRGRTDHVLGEVVDPFLDLELVFVELEREVGHRRLRSVPTYVTGE